MNEEAAQEHALHLLALYVEIMQANEGYKHDPEEHNLCTAVVEPARGATETYVSYSNPSCLTTLPTRGIRATLIPEGRPHRCLIHRPGRQDLHTEVRLLNYLYSIERLSRPGTVTLFSTRSVCTTCRSAIATAQTAVSRQTGLVALELRAEDRGHSLERAYIYNVRPGTGMLERDDPSGQGSVATF